MPIYEYRCDSCKCEFEYLSVSMNNAKPQCPECCTKKVQRLLSAGAIRPQGIPTGSGGFQPPRCKSSGG